MKAVYTIILLTGSNIFMAFAWYGHLKFKNLTSLQNAGLFTFIMISWGLAFFEYCLQVPANRIGYSGNDGPFNLIQLRILQEVISLIVFSIFTLLIFKSEVFKWNHIVAFLCLIAAVYFTFKK